METSGGTHPSMLAKPPLSVPVPPSRPRRSRRNRGRSMPSTSRFRRETPHQVRRRAEPADRPARWYSRNPASGSSENRSRRRTRSRKRVRLVAAPLENQCQVTLTSPGHFPGAIASVLPWVTISRRRQSDRSQVLASLRSQNLDPKESLMGSLTKPNRINARRI
jgi:hypothetical protein